MKQYKTLSLFDGISCGRLALAKAGIVTSAYDAYEIDDIAIQISKNNCIDVNHFGSVVGADFRKHAPDLILAGFPCQDLSISKANRAGLKGARSGLFWELVRAIEETAPEYFLIENNWKMPKEDEETISETLGVTPLLINSSCFSAQSRNRLYWTNIPVDMSLLPADSGLCVENILFTGKHTEKNLFKEVKFNGKEDEVFYHDKTCRIGTIGKGGQGERVYSIYGKSCTLTANGGGRGAKTGLYLTDDMEVRKLLPIEAERLQCLPDNYTQGFTDNQRLKAINNGWTVDVISFILGFLPR